MHLVSAFAWDGYDADADLVYTFDITGNFLADGRFMDDGKI